MTVPATIQPISPTTVFLKHMLAGAVNLGVRYHGMKTIHGGRSILVAQQQSTEWTSLPDVFRMVCSVIV